MEEKTNYCKLLITSVTKFFIWVGLIVNLIFLIVYVPIELYNEKQELNLVFTFGILFFDILGIFFTLMLLWSTYNNSIAAVCLSLVFAIFYVFLFVIPIVVHTSVAVYALVNQENLQVERSNHHYLWPISILGVILTAVQFYFTVILDRSRENSEDCEKAEVEH